MGIGSSTVKALRKCASYAGITLLGVVLVVLLIILSPIWLPIMLVHEARSAWRCRRFIRKRRGRVYVIWHARREWYDFVRNNVLPVLPSNVTAMQDRAHGGHELRMVHAALCRALQGGTPRPFLMFVGRKRVHAFSLNGPLQEVKRRPGRSASVQAEVRAVLTRVIAEYEQQVEVLER